jgi:rubrerythrin
LAIADLRLSIEEIRGGQMAEDIKVALQVLQQAMKIEEEGRRFYLAAAERTQSPAGQTLFRQLAQDEEEHYRLLKGQFDALSEGEPWVDYPQAAKRVATLQPIFPRSPADFQKAVDPHATDLEALWTALGTESNSYDLYRRAAEEVQSPEAKGMYRYLANVERKHYNLLLANYQTLMNTGVWPV